MALLTVFGTFLYELDSFLWHPVSR